MITRRAEVVHILALEDSVKTLVHALVLSRLDYCNSVLANLPEVTLAPLIRVQHSAARLIQNLRRQDSVSLVMMELHWLPLHHRITFKLCSIDARHPPWSLPKIHEGDGFSRVYLAGPRAPSVCRDPELRHPSR